MPLRQFNLFSRIIGILNLCLEEVFFENKFQLFCLGAFVIGFHIIVKVLIRNKNYLSANIQKDNEKQDSNL